MSGRNPGGSQWRGLHIAACIGMMLCSTASAEQSVDYVAEHILEVPMDMRYAAFPASPHDLARPQWQWQLGLGRVTGGSLANTVPMLGLSRYVPVSASAGWLVGGFLDGYWFSGRAGPASMALSFARVPSLPAQFDVNIRDVSGSATHAGLFVSRVRALDSGARLQAGLAVERLDVAGLRVSFRTLGLAQNFDATVDYAGVYNMITPFVSYESAPRVLGRDWQTNWSARVAWPLPGRGFKGRLIGPGLDVSGDSASAGNGKHMPDMYLGLGYVFEHRPSGLRMDLGATLFSLATEPLVHREIGQALMLTIARRF
ncbi:MAG: hypothetical protein R3E83_07495 [Burkholderiaceae bacterium]